MPTVANNACGMWVDFKFEFIFTFCYGNGDYSVSKNVYISCTSVQTQDLSDYMQTLSGVYVFFLYWPILVCMFLFSNNIQQIMS